MLKHKATMEEAERLNIKVGTVIGLVPVKYVKGAKKRFTVYLDGEKIAENFLLTEKED